MILLLKKSNYFTIKYIIKYCKNNDIIALDNDFIMKIHWTMILL